MTSSYLLCHIYINGYTIFEFELAWSSLKMLTPWRLLTDILFKSLRIWTMVMANLFNHQRVLNTKRKHRCEIQPQMYKKIMLMSHRFDCRVPVDIDYGNPMFKWSAVPWRKLGYKDSIFINGHQGVIFRSSRTVVLLSLHHMSFLLFQVTCKSTVFSAAFFSGGDKRDIKSAQYWPFAIGIHRWQVGYPHKRPMMRETSPSLQWLNYGGNGASNHQPHDCLLNR